MKKIVWFLISLCFLSHFAFFSYWQLWHNFNIFLPDFFFPEDKLNTGKFKFYKMIWASFLLTDTGCYEPSCICKLWTELCKRSSHVWVSQLALVNKHGVLCPSKLRFQTLIPALVVLLLPLVCPATLISF